MSDAPRVMFYVQHLLGIGHLARASRICAALKAAGAEVTVVTGGLPVPGFPPEGLDHVALPPLATAGEGFSGLADGAGAPVTPAYLDARRDALLAAFARLRPEVVVTEAFPFGRRQVRFEMLPLIAAIEAAHPRPALVASVRDILQSKVKPGRNEETVALVQAHYDRVLVHGDPAFVTLGDTFPLADQIADRVSYTGLVAAPPPLPSDDRFDVVVSAGGGAVGGALSLAALAAAAELPGLARWAVITGPNLPEAEAAAVADAAAGLPEGRVSLFRFRPDFPALLAAARLSVSQAGYNTVCDILQARCRAVLVPFAAGGETEQTLRAGHLQAAGRATMLPEAALGGPALAAAIRAALAGPDPSKTELAVDGAAQTAQLLCELTVSRRVTKV
ncbi:glycosyltransferase [Frigidibacter sp. MR17.14]|uniref:glycosyltransferase family protein n=1 Tax=Frigidibacter sp. MR17.14 TaxID=3126509 RepID=UPI003012AEB7